LLRASEVSLEASVFALLPTNEDDALCPRIRLVLVCADVVVRGLRGVLVLFSGGPRYDSGLGCL